MSTDVHAAKLLARLFPETDTITLGEWRARAAAGPAPYPPTIDRRAVCPQCGRRFTRSNAPRHVFCCLHCRLRWQAAAQRQEAGR